jgi:hypothetical protein
MGNDRAQDLTSLDKRGFFNSTTSNMSESNLLSQNFKIKPLLNESLSSQGSWSKTARWMYRYNLLHRRSILNSHKSTLTKRLIGSGFYDSSLDSLNIQISSIKTLNPNRRFLISNIYSASYKGFFDVTASQSTGYRRGYAHTLMTSPSLLSFSEESFFWALKKFTSFNTLGTLYRESLPVGNFLNKVRFQHNWASDSNWATSKLTYKEITPLLDQLVIESTYLKQTPTGIDNRCLNSNVSYLTAETSDFFSLEFTEKMIILLRQPTQSTSVYPYYSFLHQPATKAFSIDFKKLN